MLVRPARTLTALLTFLVLLGHLAQVLHRSAHAHVYCARHDRVEHAGHGHAGTGEQHCDGGSAQPTSPGEPAGGDEGDDHELCPFLAPGLSTGEEPGGAEAIHALAPVGNLPAPRPPLRAEVLWPLAPKHSPPVTV